jgi:hypothetical protein
LPLRLGAVDVTGTGQMKEGLGEIRIEFSADVPRSTRTNFGLIFENHH